MNEGIRRSVLRGLVATVLILIVALAGAQQQEASMGTRALRDVEAERLKALVDGDKDVADRLHADDFQLINPSGGALTKAEYLGALASGAIDYLVWEPVDEIAVRFHGTSAVLRYRARLEIAIAGQPLPMAQFWHTDVYELRDGSWQVVWSQATEIR